MRKLLKSSLLLSVATITFFGFAYASGGAIDTSMLQKAFKNASSVDKAQVQQVMSALQSHDYGGALTSLGKLSSSPNLNPEQQNAVQNTVSQVKAEQLGKVQKGIGGGALTNPAGQAPSKAAEEFNKAFK